MSRVFSVSRAELYETTLISISKVETNTTSQKDCYSGTWFDEATSCETRKKEGVRCYCMCGGTMTGDFSVRSKVFYIQPVTGSFACHGRRDTPSARRLVVDVADCTFIWRGSGPYSNVEWRFLSDDPILI